MQRQGHSRVFVAAFAAVFLDEKRSAIEEDKNSFRIPSRGCSRFADQDWSSGREHSLLRMDRSLANRQHLTVLSTKKGAERNIMAHEADPLFDRPRRSGGNIWTHVLGTVALIAIVIAVAVGVFHWNPFDSKAKADPGRADSSQCNKVTYDPNHNFNVVSRLGDDGLAVHNRNEDLAAVKADAKNLAERAWLLGITTDPHDSASLVDQNSCLSERGIQIYNAVYEHSMGTSSNVASINVDENAVAPAELCNSGMGPKGPVVNQVCGIQGDRSAIHYVITLKSGQVIDFYILKRCGNPTFKVQPEWQRVVIVTNPPPYTPPPTTIVPPPPGCPGGCIVTPPPSCENGGIPPELCVPVTPPPTCENGGIPPEQCIPTCPPGYVGVPPNCLIKDYGNGPEPSLPPQIPFTPAPAQPQYAEPTAPVLPAPPPVYVPPTQSPVIVAPTITPNPTPRTTVPAPLPEVPTATSAPEAGTCVPAPGKTSC